MPIRGREKTRNLCQARENIQLAKQSEQSGKEKFTQCSPSSAKGFFRVGLSGDSLLNDMNSTLHLHSPRTAAFYNERFEPLRRREARCKKNLRLNKVTEKKRNHTFERIVVGI